MLTILFIPTIVVVAVIFYFIGGYFGELRFKNELEFRYGIYESTGMTYKGNSIHVRAEVMELSKSHKGISKVEFIDVQIVGNVTFNSSYDFKNNIKKHITNYIHEGLIDWYDTGHLDRKRKIQSILNSK